ncbi:MAG: S-layer homology domain-containing protein [Paenibacillaceae bacterium]|nr:S-layer homology domain-containing protein [Paenibacillaceae bacterium]
MFRLKLRRWMLFVFVLLLMEGTVSAVADNKPYVSGNERSLPAASLSAEATAAAVEAASVQETDIPTPVAAQASAPAAVGRVTDLQLTPAPGEATVRWRDPQDPAFAGVHIYWRQSGAAVFKGWLAAKPGEQQAELTGLTNGSTYEVKVAAADSNGRESVSVAGTFLMPQGVSVTRIGASADGGIAGTAETKDAAEKPLPELDMSGDGRYVAFTSADALVPGAEGDFVKVFLYDRRKDELQWISRPPAGGVASANSAAPRISRDGRYIAFQSAMILTDGDNNGVDDVFLYDRDADANGVFDESGETALRRISVDPASGRESRSASIAPVISADGRYVAFTSWADDLVPSDRDMATDVYLYGVADCSLTLASAASGIKGDGASWSPSISADGGVVAFVSVARNLDPDKRSDSADLFVYNRLSRSVERITADAPDVVNPIVSGDGRRIVLASGGRGYLYDRDAGALSELIVTFEQGYQLALNAATWRWSGDGDSIVFSGNHHGVGGTYRYDFASGRATLVSRTYEDKPSGDDDGMAAVSGDGQTIAFVSRQPGIVTGDGNGAADVFVRALRPDSAAGSAAFVDITHHWSRPYLEWLAAGGWVEGDEDYRFQPDLAITRAELVKLLVRLPATSPAASEPASRSATLPKPASIKATFSPVKPTLFGLPFPTMRLPALRAIGLPPLSAFTGAASPTAAAGGASGEPESFADVPADAWYAPYVREAQKRGLVEGDGDGNFRPDAGVSREEMMTMLYRWLHGSGLQPEAETEAKAEVSALAFGDAGDIDGWAMEAMAYGVRYAYLEGMADGILLPQAAASRAQAATLIWRVLHSQDAEAEAAHGKAQSAR